MQNSKVSIIIPVYNGSNYLRKAIDSALFQTYPNFEVIVVNDGSLDRGKTENIAKFFGKKIRYFYKKNGGVSSALNFGICKSKGEWISWLSHDDIYFPDKLERQIKFSKKHPRARFIFSSSVKINEKGILHSVKEDKNRTPRKEPQIRQLLSGNIINGCTTLIHKSCFKKVGLFNENNLTAQDYEMWIMISLHFKMYRCPGVVLKQRIHHKMGSLALRSQHRRDILDTIQRIDNQLSIEQVFPERFPSRSTTQSLAKCHIELAELLMRNWHSKVANRHYAIAWKSYPCLKNKALIPYLIGADLFHLRKSLFHFYWEFLVTKSIISKKIKNILCLQV